MGKSQLESARTGGTQEMGWVAPLSGEIGAQRGNPRQVHRARQ